MIRFEDIQYTRPDYEQLERKKQQAIAAIGQAADFEQAEALLLDFEKEFNHCETMTAAAAIRGYLDGTDENYAREMAWCLGQSGSFDASSVCEAVFRGPFRKEFEAKYGSFLRESVENESRLHAAGEEWVREEQEILAACHQHVSGMTFDYNGERVSASRLSALEDSEDEAVRKAARAARHRGYAEQGEAIGGFLDRLVKVRDRLAKANGFPTYLEYCNTEKQRYTYGEKELAEFCANVRKYILPLVEKNYRKIQERLKLDIMTTDDTGIYFADGNAKPLGGEAFVREKAGEMFDDMDPAFGEAYRRMNENGYINIGISDTKVTGIGFTTIIPDMKTPYIFGNFLGDDETLAVFLHECGHALQMRFSLDRYPLHQLHSQVQDLSELPSKSMELFSHEYAPLFFGKDADKYVKAHLSGFLEEIADYCMFHEFETFLYTRPEASPQERIDRFCELQDIYKPGLTFTAGELRQRGCYLYANSTIFSFVRYVISYSLNNLSAIYLAAAFKKDRKKGAALFRKLGEIGGTLDYHEALAHMGLKPAYSEEAVREAAAYLQEELGL